MEIVSNAENAKILEITYRHNMSLKILFITQGKRPDYLNDCLYHGLMEVPDVDLYCNADMWYMHDDIKAEIKSKLYGKGFTMYGRLPAHKRPQIPTKLRLIKLIRDNYFDAVIYGSIWRSTQFFHFVRRSYDRGRILLVDGEDHQRLHQNLSSGIYFKRENVALEDGSARPIGFAIPEQLIVEEVPEKQTYWATVIPGNRVTYVFDNEADYYRDYQRSHYAITTKKSGWDCLRHYEIMMNGCVPYFPFLEHCPPQTMANLPKRMLRECFEQVNSGNLDGIFYKEVAASLLDYTKTNLTTKVLAKYVIGSLQ